MSERDGRPAHKKKLSRPPFFPYQFMLLAGEGDGPDEMNICV